MKPLRFFVLIVLFAHTLFAEGAESWQSVRGPNGGSIQAMVSDGSMLYGASGGAVYKSADNGASWTYVGVNPAVEVNSLLYADGTLYAVYSDALRNHGVFKSADGGASWTGASSGLPGISNPISALMAANGALYANTLANTLDYGSYDRLYKSVNRGASWAVAGNGLPSFSSVVSLVAINGTLHAGTVDPELGFGGFYRSSDGGDTWTSAGGIPVNGGVAALVAENGTLYAGLRACGSKSCMAAGGVYKSGDGGNSWVAASFGMTNTDTTALVSANGVFYAGTHGGGVNRSLDGGGSWTAVNGGLTSAGMNILWLRATNSALFAGTDSGVQRLNLTKPPVTKAQSDCLFNWAENTYPQYLAPTQTPSQTSGIYYYRYYSATNAYLGIDNELQHLVYLGPPYGETLYDLGDAGEFLAAASCR